MSSLNAGKFKIFCFVLKKCENTFHVDIAASDTVSDLKDSILNQNPNTLGDVDAHQLNLYKHYIRPSSNLKAQLDNIQLSEKDKLVPTTVLSSTFHDASRGDVHVIGVIQTDGRVFKRKLAEDDLERNIKPYVARRWTVNGSIRQIDIPGCYYLDPGLQPSSALCLTAVENSQFVLLSGARASGKSTRLLSLEVLLGNMSYKPVYFSFEAIDYTGTLNQFWQSIGSAIQRSLCYESLSSPIVTRQTFFDAFQAKNWKQDIVLLIDEFSELHSASADFQNDFLRTLREIRNNRNAYAIKSVIAAGTFSILLFNPSESSISPFNISDHIENPYFTEEEAKNLFKEFGQDNGITIEDAIVEDIWVKSNGHPGLLCLCGRTVYKNLQLLRCHSSTLSYTSWRRFPVKELYHEVAGYPTFQSLAKSLTKPTAADALQLFRSHFAGYLGEVELFDDEVSLGDFLTTEGVLLKPDGTKPIYHMASPLLDGYIRTSILPPKFSRTPLIAPPTQTKNNEATLDVLGVLKESVKYIGKDTIRLAVSRSYITALVKVGGLSRAQVPRESVYDTELVGILSNWLRVSHGWSVTGQWHLRNPSNKHKYTDIVLDKDIRIVLEILATGTKSDIRSHVEKTPEYKSLLAAEEAWVVHFTCQDDFHPTWQSDAELDDGVNVVHFAHDIDFTRVQMHARFKDTAGKVKEIDEPLAIGI